MKKLLILLTATLIMLSACSKKSGHTVSEVNGIQVHKNSSEPAESGLKIELKEIFTINGADGQNGDTNSVMRKPITLETDENGNIYVLDVMAASIKKYTADGKFIKSFGRNGSGPGEMRFPNSLYLYKDTIIVSSGMDQKLIKFDKDGNFIANGTTPGGQPQFLVKAGEESFVGYFQSFERKDNKFTLSFDIKLVDGKLKEKKVLHPYSTSFEMGGQTNMNVLDMITPYTAGNKEIFVAENSEDRYKINAFDFNGKPLYTVEKNYRKLPLTKDEAAAFDSTMRRASNGNGQTPLNAAYKKAINNMHVDKEGRLWVMASRDRSKGVKNEFLVDLFKDGVYLNTVTLPGIKQNDYLDLDNLLFFKGNRIYLMNMSDLVIKVYEY